MADDRRAWSLGLLEGAAQERTASVPRLCYYNFGIVQFSRIRCFGVGSPLLALTLNACVELIEAEAYFNVDLNCDRLAILHCRCKLPLLHRFDSFLVQTQS
jgi:hypothetical protein